jgi:hypothetical protein
MRALSMLGLLRMGETFGLMVSSSAIRSIASSEFARLPKSLNENGRADPTALSIWTGYR